MNQTKTNSKKKYAPLMLAGLMGVGALGVASAFLTNKESATQTNLIKPGTFNIVFENEQNAINLSGNDAIPMTSEYAKQNLTAYSYTIKNDGDLPMDYAVVLDETSNYEDLPIRIINTQDRVVDGQSATKLSSLDVMMVNGQEAEVPALEAGRLEKGQSATHTLYVHIDENCRETSSGPIDGKTASIKLTVKGVQDTDGKAPYAYSTYLGEDIKNFPELAKNVLANVSGLTVHEDHADKSVYAKNIGANLGVDAASVIEKLKGLGFTNVEKENTTPGAEFGFVATDTAGNKVSLVDPNPSPDEAFYRLILEIKK